jgi:hypothetical protein
MRTHKIAIWSAVAALLAGAIIAGCGGGGSAYSAPSGGGGGHPSPTPTVSPSPTPGPSATPVLLGNMNYATGGAWPNPTEGPANHAEIDVTCGCTNVAGTGLTDSTGGFTIQTASTPVPKGSPTPNPSYTIVPGRNYMVITTQTQTGNKAQGWTMIFAGNDSTRNQFLNPGVDQSDTATAAVALWVYGNSSPGSVAFDDWNFVTLQAFYQKFITSPTAEETTLLTDIVSAQVSKVTMYPAKPGWRPNRIKNATIAADVAAINTATDPSVPTPCPGSPPVCTGTPTP